MDYLPLGLRQALESGNVVLFVGAGVGANVLTPDGDPAPDGGKLAEQLADHFSIDTGGSSDLAKVAQVVELRKGRSELESFLRKTLANLEPDVVLRWFFSLRWRAIFTTNYDHAIQRAYSLNPKPLQTPVTMAATSDLRAFDRRVEVPVYHLHGTLFGSAKSHIIITEDDYARFREQRRMLFEILKSEFATSTFFYVGYSNRDPNWKMLLEELRAEFLPASMPMSYRVVRSTDILEREILENKGIKTIDYTLAQFVEYAASTLEGIGDKDVFREYEKDVPSDLAPAYDQYPAAVLRLLSSWQYVNQASFDRKPNTRAFLHGDRPNWALIGAGHQIVRDIEEPVYDELLDYATSDAIRRTPVLVLGPAGYGTTTVLMALAAQLVKDRAGPVFMHRAGAPLIEGDIEFALSLFPDQRPFLVVDNAADHADKLRDTHHRLKEGRRNALFLIGDRLNEWRQRQARWFGREYVLEPLSDPEINRLIACLDEHNELNKLAALPKELQFVAIKTRHEKELLVAMREATEDNRFDAILEDEYRGIAPELAQKLYLIVCCFYQFGGYVRDSLLAELLNQPLPQLYQTTRESTEGVVLYELIDPSYGSYSARARHRTIAKVVWERCCSPGERQDITLAALAALNLQYKADRDAFGHFVRSDYLVDSIRTFDGKVRFFERACQKEPLNPYVRQHYARMLSREGKPQLALSQIEEALKINAKPRVLHHTRGVALAQLSRKIESNEIARRRMVQAEDAFRRCIAMYRRDEYAYEGLARLYLNWAKRTNDDGECAEYIAKVEDTISEGLREVRVRDGLWIVSAEVQQFLGDEPSRLAALEKAVTATPGSAVARYLLARSYRKKGSPGKALETLEPVIKEATEEFRCFVEYGRAMLELGHQYSEVIAVLRLSTLYGLSDPRFIALLGGLLFVDGEFSEAEKVFDESIKRDLPAEERQRIQIRPTDPKDPKSPLTLRGKVVKVKAGYSFIELPGYPDLLCPGSKYSGIAMTVGLEVTVELAFLARGVIAVKPRPV